MFQNWEIITRLALQNVWGKFLNFIPALFIAIIVFIVGWFIAIAVGRLVAEILKGVKFNRIFEKGAWKEALEKAELKIEASEFIGAIFKWTIVIVFLQIAVGILGWTQFTDILEAIIGYLPNVIVAALIFVVAIIVADIIEKLVVVTAEGTKFVSTRIAGRIAKWAIWIFAILAILQQLEFAAADWVFSLIKIAFIGIVAMAAIAFGLGGKDVAAELLQNFKNKLKG